MGEDIKVDESFVSFVQVEPYSSMSACEAYDEYLKRVKGKFNKELSEFFKEKTPDVMLKCEEKR